MTSNVTKKVLFTFWVLLCRYKNKLKNYINKPTIFGVLYRSHGYGWPWDWDSVCRDHVTCQEPDTLDYMKKKTKIYTRVKSQNIVSFLICSSRENLRTQLEQYVRGNRACFLFPYSWVSTCIKKITVQNIILNYAFTVWSSDQSR